MTSLQIINDMDKGLTVMQNAAAWMEREGFKHSEWWKPENMNRSFMAKHTEPEEYFVALVGDTPAASMVLEDTERNQSWKSVDDNIPQKALYVH